VGEKKNTNIENNEKYEKNGTRRSMKIWIIAKKIIDPVV